MGYQFTSRLCDLMKKAKSEKRRVTLQLVTNLCPNHSLTGWKYRKMEANRRPV
jgi:hypothetical protein